MKRGQIEPPSRKNYHEKAQPYYGKIENHKNCLEATQFQNRINYIKKVKFTLP